MKIDDQKGENAIQKWKDRTHNDLEKVDPVLYNDGYGRDAEGLISHIIPIYTKIRCGAM
jgi:hypothetical protein